MTAPSVVRDQLLALSFDGAASPVLAMRDGLLASEAPRQPYPSDTFISHLHPAADQVPARESQPFSRGYAGREWTFVHQGTLAGDLRRVLRMGGTPSFPPRGSSDAELVFCWLLEVLQAESATRIADVPWERWHDWFRLLNDLGTANFVLSDGQDLMVYQDRYRFAGLWTLRRTPLHPPVALETNHYALAVDTHGGAGLTVVMVAAEPLSDEGWLPMYPGQLLVLRQGSLWWNSHSGYAPEAGPAPPVIRQTRAPEAQTLSVTHQTIYRYAVPVMRSQHRLLLRPLQDELQQVLEHRLEVTPSALGREFEDILGNGVRWAAITGPYQELRIESRSVVRLQVPPPLTDPLLRPALLPFPWALWQRHLMSPYLMPPDLPEDELQELSGYALAFARRQDHDMVQTLADINATIAADFRYVSGSTTHATTPYEVYQTRTGVCQDFTNLFICLARLLGIPARYRVGYIYTGGRDYGNNAQSEASHAWAEVYLPETGWRGFDPTNGCLAGPDHVRVACGRDAWDATPTSGTYEGGGRETLEVSVRVVRVE